MSIYILSYDPFSTWAQEPGGPVGSHWLVWFCHTRKLYLFEMVTVLYCRERHSRKRETALIAFTLFTRKKGVVGANRLKQPAVAVDE